MQWLFLAVFLFLLLLGVNGGIWAYYLGAKKIADPVVLGISLATAQYVLFTLFGISCFLLVSVAICQERVKSRKRAKKCKKYHSAPLSQAK
ncbi:hypothetical protein IC229_23095 [Spirosoma sp. BT702]|uniref:Uncharacterized protein n=1 Tax=Spirosoma profusum TaxID=2771354 RepID=A0A926XYX7_9BACT|nr:hypothetical protein [Spirosoma profusum]MBD2703549.1 hypothetical protein [Spirosoma profusum]